MFLHFRYKEDRTVIIKIVLGLLGLGIVVFIHEAGHFIAAKLSGIKVETFSLGWGFKLVSFTWRETEYRLSLLPLGGYCKLKGEDAMKEAWVSGSNALQTGEGTFYGASPWKRIFVAVSGPIANLFFAIFAFSLVWLIGFSYPTFSNRVILESDYAVQAEEKVYPATRAGLLTGDYIISIENHLIGTYRDLQEIVAKSPDKSLTLTYKRDGATQTTSIKPELNKETGAGRIGVYAWIEPKVETVRKDSSAYIAGIKTGDLILKINGKPIPHTLEIIKAIRDAKNEPLAFDLERQGKIISTKVIPHIDASGKPDIGLAFQTVQFSSRIVGFSEALKLGLSETFETLIMTVKGIGLLFRGVDLSQAVSGPVRITYIVGEVAAQGFSQNFSAGLTSVLNFLSLLSVALFFMNLLPIPALDGGLLVLFLVEGILHRPLRPQFLFRYQYVGLIIIFILIILSTMSDVFYFFRR